MVMQTEDPARKAQGWLDTQVTSIERRVLPAKASLRQLWKLMGRESHAVHLFGSPFDQPRQMWALVIAAIRGLDYYLISEPYSPGDAGYFDDSRRLANRVKAALRPWIYRIYGITVGRRARGIFAISELAVSQYARSGVQSERLFPFGYFVPATPAPVITAAAAAVSPTLRVVFVGSLIRRKGVDLLTAAVAQLRREGHAVTLDAYGSGSASGLGFDGAASYHRGSIPFGKAQDIIAGYDVLVLPSHYDGWGVVVNEALLAGVPVICSDAVGARVLVETFGAGEVFPSGDAAALADRLRDLLQTPSLLPALRQGTHRAAACSTPEDAARYMWSVIGRRPGALPLASPWYPHDGR
ncbi:MAG: glycosyltransferase family 4 protein [Aquabacterium sp.]|nr:glycosyltransferase family 4 protein [Aquabacterium sp.]